MLKKICVTSGATIAVVAGLAAPASAAGTVDGVRFTPGLPCKSGMASQLNAETFVGTLRTLSYRGLQGLKASVPSSARGKTIGTLTIGIGSERRRVTLTAPRAGGTNLELADRDGVRVVMRPNAPSFLSVYGLPEGTTSAFLTFSGHGRGVLAPKQGTRSAQVRLGAYRHANETVQLTASQRCV